MEEIYSERVDYFFNHTDDTESFLKTPVVLFLLLWLDPIRGNYRDPKEHVTDGVME